MWSVLLTEVRDGLYDVSRETFKVLFSDDLWELWWADLSMRGCSCRPE